MSYQGTLSNGRVAATRPRPSNTLFAGSASYNDSRIPPPQNAIRLHRSSSSSAKTTTAKRNNPRKKQTTRRPHHTTTINMFSSSSTSSKKNPLELPEIVAMILYYLSPCALKHARLVSRTWNRIAQELMFHRRAYHSSAERGWTPREHPRKVRSSQFLAAGGDSVHFYFSGGTLSHNHNDPQYAKEVAQKRSIQRQHFDEAYFSRPAGMGRGRLTGLEMYGDFDPMSLLLCKQHGDNQEQGSAGCADGVSPVAALTAGSGARASLSAVTVLDLDVQTSSFALSELDLVALLAGFPRLRHLALSLSSFVRVPSGALRTSPALAYLPSIFASHANTMAGMPIVRSPSSSFYSSPTLSSSYSSSYSASSSISPSPFSSSTSLPATLSSPSVAPSSWQQHIGGGTYHAANALGLFLTPASSTMSDDIGIARDHSSDALEAPTPHHYSLETFQARNIQMSFQDILFLLTLLPNLRALELSECLTPPWDIKELVQQIQHCCPLVRRLHLQPSRGQFNMQEQLDIVRGLPDLTEVALDMPPPERVPRALHPLAALNANRLTALHLGAFEYDERSMLALHQFLCRSTQLRELYAKHILFPIELLTEPLAALALEDKLNKTGGIISSSQDSSTSGGLDRWTCNALVRLEIGFAKPKATSLIRSEQHQIRDVVEYLVQQLPSLVHLDANFHSLSLEKDSGVSTLKQLHMLETVHLVSRSSISLNKNQLDWLLAPRLSPSSPKLKKKSKKQQQQQQSRLAPSPEQGRGRSAPSTLVLESSLSPSMSPWASPVHSSVVTMPRSRSPSPMSKRLSLVMTPIMLPAPSESLTRVKTNLSEDTDLEDDLDTTRLDSEDSPGTQNWFKHLSTKVKRLLHLSPSHKSALGEEEAEGEEGGPVLSTLEQSMSSHVLPRLTKFKVTVYQRFPSQPPFLHEMMERLHKKRPALDVQIHTHAMRIQRRVRSEELNRLQL